MASRVASGGLGRSGEVLARASSIVGHPFLCIPASVFALGQLRGEDGARDVAVRAAIALGALFGLVSVVVVLGVRAGWFNDFDVSERQRRPSLYAGMIAAAAALAVWLRDEPFPATVCWVAVGVLVVSAVVNRRIKASLHTSFALYVAGLWATWSLVAGALALPLVALVAWSRVRLRRHSVAEVLVGAAIGGVAAAALVALAP